MSRRKIGLFVLLCCTVLYAADSTTTVELPDTIAAGDYCEAVAQLPQNARAISGAQVLGCDWTWYNHSGNFISWESTYPMNVAERHGVRFEGQYIFEGEGDGPKRIYDWELNVIDPNKFCDYCLFYEIPTKEKCSGPTLKNPPTNVPCSYEPDGNPLFRIMYVHINLKAGDAPGIEEIISATGDRPMGWYLANYPVTPTPSGNVIIASETKLCEKCRVGTVHCYNVSFPKLEIDSWENEIFISVWEEMEEYAGEKTKAAMAERYQFILEHETKHHDQFIELYAEPLMNAIDNLNATNRYEYCSLAFEPSGGPDRALADAVQVYLIRREKVDSLSESWDAYNAAVAALDAIDYPIIDATMPNAIKIKD